MTNIKDMGEVSVYLNAKGIGGGMYKIALIDDEMIVREGMKDLIPWERLGLELVGTAEDGLAGYTLIEEKEPDIVLLDINMPKCNGLVLTERLRIHYPAIKVVFISGYDEFNYARQALRLGVEDYILKPITKSEMKEILLKLVAQLDEEKAESQKAMDVLNRVEQSIPLMQQKLLQDLVRNQFNESLVVKQCVKANIPHNSSAYGVMVVEADELVEGEEEHALTQFVIQNIVSEVVLSKKWGMVFEIQGLTGVLYTQQEKDKSKQDALYYKHLCMIQETISELIGIKVSIGVGRLVSQIQAIHLSYEEASQVMQNRFFRGMGQIIYYSEDIKYKKADFNCWMSWEDTILNAMLDRTKLCQAIHNIGLEMKREKITLDDMQEIWGNILCGMLKRYLELNRNVMPQLPQGIHIMHEVRQVKTLEQMQKWVIALYDLCEKQMEEGISPNQKYIEGIRQFIDTHYMDPELSVKHLCEVVHISPSYL